jgi:hypothetical protein
VVSLVSIDSLCKGKEGLSTSHLGLSSLSSSAAEIGLQKAIVHRAITPKTFNVFIVVPVFIFLILYNAYPNTLLDCYSLVENMAFLYNTIWSLLTKSNEFNE